MNDASEASIQNTDCIKPHKMSSTYTVRAANGSIIKLTDSLDEAITTAVQFRQMKLKLNEDIHCNVEKKSIIYSTIKEGV